MVRQEDDLRLFQARFKHLNEKNRYESLVTILSDYCSILREENEKMREELRRTQYEAGAVDQSEVNYWKDLYHQANTDVEALKVSPLFSRLIESDLERL